MHEKVHETKRHRITIYTTSQNHDLLAVDRCIDVLSSVPIELPKAFIQRENRIFPTAGIMHGRGYLKALRIEGLCHTGCPSSGGIYAALKRLVPSVFDVGYIREVNWQRHLYENRSLILGAARRILGHEETGLMRLWERTGWRYGGGEEESFEVLDAEILHF
jgi:hypothetical protein